jgi:hypothetical protein
MCSHTVPQSQRHGHLSLKLSDLVDIKLRDVDHLHIDFINPVLWWKKATVTAATWLGITFSTNHCLTGSKPTDGSG